MSGDSSGFNEFVIESLIGEGGMGRVYRARQVALDRWVALKILPRARESASFIERFYREARSAARLVHPNIIQIYTVGEHEGIPYFAMEYIEGEDLENIQRVTPDQLSTNEVIEIIRSVAKALSIAMEHGVVHRDIKPANIMITRTGVVKVMDFGLAKGLAVDSVTQEGLVVGTPAYMSPEQGASKVVDTRSDIYSLGCVMYTCLAGKAPFAAENVASILYKHMYEPPEPLSKFCPGLSAEIENICLKMMSKKPADRYQTPMDLVEDLAKVPSNPAAAELALARRASVAFSRRNAKPGAGAPGGSPAPAQGLLPVTKAVPNPFAPAPAAPAPVVLGAPKVPSAPAGQAPAPALGDAATPQTATPAFGTPPLPPSPAGFGLVQTPALAKTGASSTRLARSRPLSISEPDAETSERAKSATKSLAVFSKLSDGRWTYNSELGSCSHAEGLAADLRSALGEKPQNLGDCLLCCNWNKRLGCAVAYCNEIEKNIHRFKGSAAAFEQAIAWAGAGRFERALAILQEYIRQSPDDPEAYREMARIYDRPEYRGKDKRRAIVLYERFVDLANKSGAVSKLDITRAQERTVALRAGSSEPPRAGPPGMNVGVTFQAHYRGAITCYGYGVITNELLCFARCGEIDPETGVASAAMGGTVGRATALLRMFRTEHSKREETIHVKHELGRLTELSVPELQHDPLCILTIPSEQITGVDLSVDLAVGIRQLVVKTPQTIHAFFFTEAAAFKADQCHELLKRRLQLRTPA